MSLHMFLGIGLALSLLSPTNSVNAPSSVQLIHSTNHSSYASYEKTFTMDPDNGEDAHLWIENTSKSNLYMKISVGNNTSLEVPIDKGTQKKVNLAVGVTTDFKVYVFSSTGHKVDITISARQF
ncbi:hypothetical protein NST33_11870 [Paenibacillus sp. FSL L8-0435]|uniref:hypothetical protein n=1 Tax=Paenibacillus TaxID=44249 RepID=UPI001C8D8CA8|nr:hypothetical protein [Paenibacillus xylanexedens]MBY0119714.1 hypothetical protein [Paenibacillus xylanexedens]